LVVGGKEGGREGGKEGGREGQLTVLLFHHGPRMPDVVDMATAGVSGGPSLEDGSGGIDAAELREKHAEGLR
jgi:hypothetical protein